jgi:microcystin-dependent protein
MRGFPTGEGTIPIGTILQFIFSGDDVPDKWLLCDGSAVDGAVYPDLHKKLMKTFASPNLPDLRGRTVVGKDNMGGTSANRITASWADSVLGTGGAETHTLSTTEIPAHTHGAQGKGGSASAEGIYIAHSEVVASTVQTDSTGGGGAHNNLQPSIAMNFIIRALP